jgi:hypothetical protein
MSLRMTPLQKLVAFRQSWHSHTRDRAARYAATMTQVEALRVEVSALEAEIRRTERSTLAPAHKDARIRGLASRAAESYGRMLSLLREAADIYPAVLTEPLDIPHRFSEEERRHLVRLPERPPSLVRLELGVVVAAGVAFVLAAILLSKLYPVIVPMAGLH